MLKLDLLWNYNHVWEKFCAKLLITDGNGDITQKLLYKKLWSRVTNRIAKSIHLIITDVLFCFVYRSTNLKSENINSEWHVFFHITGNKDHFDNKNDNKILLPNFQFIIFILNDPNWAKSFLSPTDPNQNLRWQQ